MIDRVHLLLPTIWSVGDLGIYEIRGFLVASRRSGSDVAFAIPRDTGAIDWPMLFKAPVLEKMQFVRPIFRWEPLEAHVL